jgi:hypothetical protein
MLVGGGFGGGGCWILGGAHKATAPVTVRLPVEGVLMIPVMLFRSQQAPRLVVGRGLTYTHAAHASVNMHRAQQSCQPITMNGAPAIVIPV